MPEDKVNKEKNKAELLRVNEIIAGKEKEPDIKKEKEPISIETGQEQKIEVHPETTEGGLGGERIKAPSPVQPAGSAPVDQARIREIENILAEGLEEIYVNLPAAKQQEFKKAGEETARQINGLLNSAKVKINKIVNLIIKWLSIIPGVNRFFIEQEAKIKADEILKVRSKK